MEHQIELTAESLWDEVSGRLRGALNETTFHTWFAEAAGVELSDDAFTISVPNDFTREWIEGHFLGRGYSEAWELFAGSPALACDVARNPACDAAQTQNAYQGRPHSGVTVIESYATLGIELAIDARLTRYFRLRAGVAYARDQSHLITGDDVGTPTQPGGRVSAPAEYNPAYRPVIDQVGRRYLVDNVDQLDAKVTAQLLF